MPVSTVRDLVTAIGPADELERAHRAHRAHRADVLTWLSGTDDIYSRRRPATPPRHLVSYTALLDPTDGAVFLVDHRRAGLALPPGGHVEPGRTRPSPRAGRPGKNSVSKPTSPWHGKTGPYW